MSKIKEARLSAGLSRRAMSEKLGIPVQTILNWENGRRNAIDYVERLVVEKLERIKKEEPPFDPILEEIGVQIDEDKAESVKAAVLRVRKTIKNPKKIE